ncbi:hypothetical protein C0J52_14340 [Blattella germanica]|nr:hypothetical protein C0J52_14340 [Blattella germanica]
MLVFMVVLSSVYAQKKGSDGYTDEERPYEFGFNIEGYQHRHEKKELYIADENGIIMGEFGFITADGIYHVTVYATDENGDFKILKMKNIKVGFPPGSALKPTTPKAPVTSRPAIVSTIPSTIRTSSIATTVSTTPRLILNNGCGSCKVPVPTTKKPVSPPSSPSFGSPSPPGLSPGSSSKPLAPGGIFGSPSPGTTFGSPSPPGNTFVSPAPGNFPGSSPTHPGNAASPGFPSPPGNTFASPSPPGSVFGPVAPPGKVHGTQSPPGSTFGSPSPPGSTFGSPSPPGSVFGQPSPPSNTFGSPSPPGSTFGSPSPPGSVFGPPSPPSSTFGSPSPPGSTFGSPSPPASVFGPPSSPGSTFGSPSPPGNVPGVSSPPGNIFGSPSPPGSTFGAPSPPGSTFGAPSPPGSTFGAPSPGFGSSQPPKDDTPSHLTPIGAEKPGLPSGITEGDVMDLLYKFNYTVGFHGHNEEGYRNGDKNGAYFTNFRNGISERVKYVANEFGYQPNITFVPIGLESPDTPKEETEKDYGLKGYAFKWYYTR